MRVLLLLSLPLLATITVTNGDTNQQQQHVLRDKDIAIKKSVAIIGTTSKKKTEKKLQ
jgi:hypothetical protein